MSSKPVSPQGRPVRSLAAGITGLALVALSTAVLISMLTTVRDELNHPLAGVLAGLAILLTVGSAMVLFEIIKIRKINAYADSLERQLRDAQNLNKSQHADTRH